MQISHVLMSCRGILLLMTALSGHWYLVLYFKMLVLAPIYWKMNVIFIYASAMHSFHHSNYISLFCTVFG